MNSSTKQYGFRESSRITVQSAVMRSVIICLLSLFSAATVQAQSTVRVDSLLSLVQGLYEEGSYLSAEVEARRMLDNRSLPDSLRVRAEQFLAFSLVAQAKNAGAVEHFVTILKIDSTFALDPILTSPKILSVFAEAHRQYANLSTSQSPRPQPPQRSTDRGVTFRTVLFPGWEQAYQGRTIKGYSLVGAGVLSLGLTLYFDRERHTAQEEYLSANTPELAASKYARYNNFHKAEYYSIGAFLVVYVYSQLDAFFDLPPHLDPSISQTSSNTQITMHISL
jgi:hypothetical protein